jgi:phasin
MTDMPKFEVPADMRAFAEKSMEQAKKAFDTFISTAQQAVSTAEGHAAKARAGAKDVADLSMKFAEKNMNSSFEFAQKLVRAKDAQEAMQLQSEYMKAQMATLQEQAKELAAATQKAATSKG